MLTINGNTEQFLEGTLNITDELNSRNTASFDIITANTITAGQTVEIVDGLTTIFAGTIDSYRQTWLRGSNTGNRKKYSITCIDYNQLLDKGKKLACSYEDKTISFILNDATGERTFGTLIAEEGITIGTLSGGSLVLSQAVFNYIALSDALNYIKDVTGLNWNVGYDKVLTLFYRSDNIDMVDQSQILNIEKEVTRQDYRNQQLVRGGRGRTGLQTLQKPTPKPDGISREFFTRFPIAEQPLIYINTVQVNPSDIGVNGLDVGKKYYWSYGSDKITHDTSETVLPDGTTIEVTYIGLRKIVALAQNPSGIAQRTALETGTSGIYEDVEQRKELDTNQAVLDYANGLLLKYADIPERVYINSLEFNQSGLIVDINEPKIDASGQYLIESVNIYDEGCGFRYNYNLASGEALGGWVEFFRKMFASGQDFRIQNDEVLVFIVSNAETISLDELSLIATIETALTPSDTLWDIDGVHDYFSIAYTEVII